MAKRMINGKQDFLLAKKALVKGLGLVALRGCLSSTLPARAFQLEEDETLFCL